MESTAKHVENGKLDGTGELSRRSYDGSTLRRSTSEVEPDVARSARQPEISGGKVTGWPDLSRSLSTVPAEPLTYLMKNQSRLVPSLPLHSHVTAKALRPKHLSQGFEEAPAAVGGGRDGVRAPHEQQVAKDPGNAGCAQRMNSAARLTVPQRPQDDSDAMPLLRREARGDDPFLANSPARLVRSASDDALYERTLQPPTVKGSPTLHPWQHSRHHDETHRVYHGSRDSSSVANPGWSDSPAGAPVRSRPPPRPQVWNVTPRVCTENDSTRAAEFKHDVFQHRRWVSKSELEGNLEHNRCVLS